MRDSRNAAASIVAVLLIGLCLSAGAIAETETETTTRTTSTHSESQSELRFAMMASPLAGTPGYRQGNGSASLEVHGTYISVHFQAEGMSSNVHLTLVLTANGTSHSAANMTTSYEGEVEAEAAVHLASGVYSVGLAVFDASSFSSPMEVLVSSPQTVVLSLAQSAQATTTFTESTQLISPVQGGDSEDDGIRAAIQTKFIPAVIDFGESGSSIRVNDGNFSVSVGESQGGGYLVSVSATNVPGPRVLLINLTSDQARSLFSAPVLIKLDGSTVQQAATLSDVLGATTGSPARFVLVSTASSLNLLISIPHFSYHTIEIIPIITQFGPALIVDLPVLVFAVAAVSFVVLAVYFRRTRAAPEAGRRTFR